MSAEQPHATSVVGRQFGHFRITKPLGRGGMGEVYLAEDTRLNRKVAIKVLPAPVGDDSSRMRRFEQEAMAASALNHPNIVTVYEFGTDHGQAFLVTEFVEGRTLRDVLHDPTFVLEDVLHVAEQVARALAEAHKAGIIHRDIKLENIMLREDGIVKVLDFGLAKLAGPDGGGNAAGEGSSSDSRVKTRGFVTMPGNILGTPVYMSPEQARGQDVDERTDVWSLGVVIHEMLTGAPPFTGETFSDVIAAILTSGPPPLTSRLGAIPPALERLVGRSLSKNRDDRYPTIRGLLVDLRKVHAELHARRQPAGATSSRAPARPKGLTAEPRPMAADSDVVASGSAPVLSFFARPRRLVLAAAGALALGVAALSVFVLAPALFGRPTPLRRPDTAVSLTRLNLPGVLEAAISPDGRLVAYVVPEGPKYTLYLRPKMGGSAMAIAPPDEAAWHGLTFSPDSRLLYFLRNAPQSEINELYEVPVGGGRARKLITDVDSMISFAPGGRQFVFRRNYVDRRESSIVLANLDGSGERKLATRQIAEAFVNNPVWSPNGQVVATPVVNPLAGSEQQVSIVLIDVADGTQKLLGRARWRWTSVLAWMPDGRELLVTAKDQPLAPFQVWRIGYPAGDILQATNDTRTYTTVSATGDSSTLLAVQTDATAALHVAPVADLTGARRLTEDAAIVFRGVSWTPDGRILYGADAGGRRNIWITNADGGSPTRLTDDDAVNDNPVATPDGRYIVYQSERGGYGNVWRMNTDGSLRRQLTFGNSANNPSVTPDSRWIVYAARSVAEVRLWKVSIDGGDPQELTTGDSHFPVVSPDGRDIAFSHYPGGAAPWTLSIVGIEGGAPRLSFRVPAGSWRWTPDGRALICVENRGGASNFMRLPVDGGSPTRISQFTSGSIPAFDISRDGKRIVFVRSLSTSDAVLIRGFR